MINSIKQALTTRDIRRKLEIIVGIIFLTRVISMIPVPGVDASVFKQWMASNSNDALNLFSAFTGGSFENFSMTEKEQRYVELMIIELSKFYFSNLDTLHPSSKCRESICKIFEDIRRAGMC